MKITRIQIRNFRHIEALDIPVNPHGAIAVGGSARGKTTVLNAIRSALAAQDVGPDAIRMGADRAEIMLDLDDLTVRRVIGPKKSSVSVSKGAVSTSANVIATKQAYLTDLFGGALFDPMQFFLAKPKERRAKVLEVLPVTTTLAELRAFAPDLPADFDDSGHGLEVLERARKRYFDMRTEANRAATEAKKACAEVEASAKSAPPDDGTTTVAATEALASAERAAAELEARVRESAAAEVRTKATRERIAALRNDAAGCDAQAEGVPTDEPMNELRAAEAIEGEVATLEAELAATVASFQAKIADARRRAFQARATYETIRRFADEAKGALARGAALRAQADELASAIGAIATPPTAEEIAAALTAIDAARAAAEKAAAVEEGRRLRARAAESRRILADAQAAADALDATVKTLTNDAPAALLAKTNGIPGLTLEGDDILLDGVRIDHVSGSEQLDLAIEIARRANVKSKILVVDGLERLDPEAMERFVKRATADDFQLFATRVSSGDLEIMAIAPDDERKPEAAE